MAEELARAGLVTCVHKHYSVEEVKGWGSIDCMDVCMRMCMDRADCVSHHSRPNIPYHTTHIYTTTQWVAWATAHPEALPFVAISMGTGEEDFQKARFVWWLLFCFCKGGNGGGWRWLNVVAQPVKESAHATTPSLTTPHYATNHLLQSQVSKVLAAVEVPTICMDVANGYSEHFVQVKKRKEKERENKHRHRDG